MIVVNNGVKYAFIGFIGLDFIILYHSKTTLSLRVRAFLLSICDCVEREDDIREKPVFLLKLTVKIINDLVCILRSIF